MRLLGTSRSVYLFMLTLIVSVSLQNVEKSTKSPTFKRAIGFRNTVVRTAYGPSYTTYKRPTTTRKPGFFRTLFSVAYEQWADTRNTYSKINQMINDNFLDENALKVETTTNPDPNASTTTERYRITRSEFNKILRRNFLGIQRLYNIELQDALRQSAKNQEEFRKQASKEISKFL